MGLLWMLTRVQYLYSGVRMMAMTVFKRLRLSVLGDFSGGILYPYSSNRCLLRYHPPIQDDAYATRIACIHLLFGINLLSSCLIGRCQVLCQSPTFDFQSV